MATLLVVLCANCSASSWQPEECADGARCPPGSRCAAAQNICVATSCGDGIVERSSNEVCDDGNIVPGDGCNELCQPEYCGNAIVDIGEVCDDGNNESDDGCRGDCLSTEFCGNDIVDTALGEECDDGNRDDGDLCTSVCKVADCTDGLWNADESDVDCGGQCGPSCWIAQSCNVGSDCNTGMCRSGICTGHKLVAGRYHTCALLTTGAVRCWGNGYNGALGYGNTDDIGDDEAPAAAGDVNVGGSVAQLVVGSSHTCALLQTGTVRCWGSSSLGYGNTDDIGDDEVPASAGDVDIGGPAVQLAAGNRHTCALLQTGAVRCWGDGEYGQLGYGNDNSIGDNEAPAVAGDVNVGGSVIQVAAGSYHTCALLQTGAVRCWGDGRYGRLGYGNTNDIGDNEFPASAGDVDIGGPAVQLAAGYSHTCALLQTGAVRCWGDGGYGRLGHGNTNDIGDNEAPATAGDVSVGGTVIQIAAGGSHTCALLASGAVRCWGDGEYGQLGYHSTTNVGDHEIPATVGDVDVGGPVIQLTAGDNHTCALLSSGAVRCWGDGDDGRLGYANDETIGDNEDPATAGNVNIGGPLI